MNKEEFFRQFNRLCVVYMKKPEKLISTGLEYFDSKLGRITSFELKMIIDYCKNNKIRPHYGDIPQIYQLLDIYDQNIKPNKIYDEQRGQKAEYCQLCDDTGFVARNKGTGIESVVTCICNRGKTINVNARNKKHKHDNTYMKSYANINRDKYITVSEYEKQHPLTIKDGELAECIITVLLRARKLKEERSIPF